MKEGGEWSAEWAVKRPMPCKGMKPGWDRHWYRPRHWLDQVARDVNGGDFVHFRGMRDLADQRFEPWLVERLYTVELQAMVGESSWPLLQQWLAAEGFGNADQIKASLNKRLEQ